MEEIVLGCEAEDKITEFSGVVTSICTDLDGTRSALLTPKIDKDGKLPPAQWFDVRRLGKCSDEIITL